MTLYLWLGVGVGGGLAPCANTQDTTTVGGDHEDHFYLYFNPGSRVTITTRPQTGSGIDLLIFVGEDDFNRYEELPLIRYFAIL